MLTVKIVWPSDFGNYSVYSANHYVVSDLKDGTTEMVIDDGGPDTRRVILGPLTRVYVMNDKGSTIDTIYK